MRSCQGCGSTNLSVRVPAEQIYTQGQDGKWTDHGVEHLVEKAEWCCSDSDNCWYEWFDQKPEEVGLQ